MQKIFKWVIIIVIIGAVGKMAINYIAPEVTDLSSMVNMKKEELEETLGVTFTENPNKVRQIYEYSDGTITVESDKKMVLHLYT